jgi:hypothetical protein
MINLLKSVILDFQESELPTGVRRHLQMDVVHGKAAVCIGVRRCGKSTYLYQHIRKLLDSGVPKENILYLNFFDDRLHGLRSRGLGLVTEAYYSIYPEKKGAETVYCFLDEIQLIAGWEPFVDRLLRTEKCEVFITGSSANMLAAEIATQMRGRALSWELFPFSFREFLDRKGIEVKRNSSTKDKLRIRNAFEEFWRCGGFPEVAGLADHLRVKIHQEYFNAVLARDIVERHDISHPRAVTDLAHWLIDNTASLYSSNNLTGYLKSLGHPVPKASVSDYLAWFEDAYFFFTVCIHDASLARRNTNSKKIYCVDHAMVTSVSSGILVNSGHLLENLVFASLRRSFLSIYYYRTRNGKEVDFIVPQTGRHKLLVQVCESLAAESTRKRELSALSDAMTELEEKSAFLVTRDEDEELVSGDTTIHVIPAWRFLLAIPDQQK